MTSIITTLQSLKDTKKFYKKSKENDNWREDKSSFKTEAESQSSAKLKES